MADYTTSKRPPGGNTPPGAGETEWRRTEPLITGQNLRERQLWGLNLVSGIRDLNGKAVVLNDSQLADFIDRAVATVELETHLVIFPVQIQEKHGFDLQEYQSWGYFRLQQRPVISIESLTVAPSTGTTLFTVPQEWVETGRLHDGQLNIIPLTTALTANPSSASGGAAGMVLMNIFSGGMQWIPSYWMITYTAGFDRGELPKVMNDLIGTVAAMEVLSMLGATYGRDKGGSLSIDGLSQSVSTPGPEVFTRRLEELEKKRMMLTKKLKTQYGQSIFSGNV